MTCGSNRQSRLAPACLRSPSGPAMVMAVVRNLSAECWRRSPMLATARPAVQTRRSSIDRSIDRASLRGAMTQNSTSERIHRAALRLFATYGFAGTGIRKIADEAGITVASLYHYVGTKEELLERMMYQSMSQLLGPAREVTGDPAQRICALVDLHVRRHARESQLCRVGDTELRSLSRARRARIVALRDEYQAIWTDASPRVSRAAPSPCRMPGSPPWP